jgi:arylsulfatase A-like enzyme
MIRGLALVLKSNRPLVCLLSLLLVACGASGPEAAANPERVILVVVDTLRRDALAVYGGKTPTPNSDALARRGQVFSNALASYHQTSMSMGSLFTGRTPSIEFGSLERPLFWTGETWCGMTRFSSERGDETCVPETLPTLAERLRTVGYETIGIASNQFLYEPSGFSRGFDTWVEVGEHPPKKGAIERFEIQHGPQTRHAAFVNEAVSEVLSRRNSDRFFLYVHFMDVHDYGFTRDATGAAPSPVRDYGRAVARLDDAFGVLVDRLEADGLLEDALVVLTSDHGERLDEAHAIAGRPGHVGNPSFQELLEVPLIVAPATALDANAPVRTEDVHRLILEAVGAEDPPASDLRPDELLLSETEYRTYLDGRFKSVVRRRDGYHHLFDLDADPDERRDLAGQRPEIADVHRARVDELSERMSSRKVVLERISAEARARLEALGYALEPGQAPEPAATQPGS